MSRDRFVSSKDSVVRVLVAAMLSLSVAGCDGGDSSTTAPAELTPEQAAIKAKYLETHPPPGTKTAKKTAKRK